MSVIHVILYITNAFECKTDILLQKSSELLYF